MKRSRGRLPNTEEEVRRIKKDNWQDLETLIAEVAEQRSDQESATTQQLRPVEKTALQRATREGAEPHAPMAIQDPSMRGAGIPAEQDPFQQWVRTHEQHGRSEVGSLQTATQEAAKPDVLMGAQDLNMHAGIVPQQGPFRQWDTPLEEAAGNATMPQQNFGRPEASGAAHHDTDILTRYGPTAHNLQYLGMPEAMRAAPWGQNIMNGYGPAMQNSEDFGMPEASRAAPWDVDISNSYGPAAQNRGNFAMPEISRAAPWNRDIVHGFGPDMQNVENFEMSEASRAARRDTNAWYGPPAHNSGMFDDNIAVPLDTNVFDDYGLLGSQLSTSPYSNRATTSVNGRQYYQNIGA